MKMPDFVINPEKHPVPAGFVDNAVDEDDILPTLELFPAFNEEFPLPIDGTDAAGNRDQPAAAQGEQICGECNAQGKLPNAEGTALTRKCPTCDGTGFWKRAGTDTPEPFAEPVLVGNLADEDDILPVPKMIF